MYCVVYANGRWALAVQHGRSKELTGQTFADVRSACAAAADRNEQAERLSIVPVAS